MGDEMLKMFDEFDTSDSGCLCMDELMQLVSALGVTPMKDALSEAMEIVDCDDGGELDFDEFVLFMGVFRVTEGFARQEVELFEDVFDRLAVKVGADAWEVKEHRLGDAMVYIFGPQ